MKEREGTREGLFKGKKGTQGRKEGRKAIQVGKEERVGGRTKNKIMKAWY